jgi:hypothetical protein
MSKKGIQIVVDFFNQMQVKRNQLFTLAGDNLSSPESKQDILLAQLLEKAKDAVKDDFCFIVDGKYPKSKKRI